MPKTRRDPAKLCGAATSKFLVSCGNLGQEKYGGRCKIHRVLSPEERTALSAVKKAARLAEYEAEEAAEKAQQRLAKLRDARDHFAATALFFGLTARETAVAFKLFHHLSSGDE